MSIFSRKKDDKKKADFSNVQSGSSSTAAEARPAAAPPPPVEPVSGTAGQTTYVVVKGDSLSKIAKRYYGDASQWRRIYDANRDQISNPDLIHPGQNLKIPGA